jgi:hypothetical protein
MYVRLTERIESLIIESSNLTRFIVLFFFVLFFDQVGLSFGSFFNQTLFNLTSIKGKQISYLLLCSGRGCGILCLHICKYSAGKQGDLFSNINVKLIKDFKDFYWKIDVIEKKNKFTHRTGSKIDLLFQVNNSKKNSAKKDPCCSRKFGGPHQTNEKEENIPSCSSNRRNSLVVVADPVGIHPSSWSWTEWPPVDSCLQQSIRIEVGTTTKNWRSSSWLAPGRELLEHRSGIQQSTGLGVRRKNLKI